MSTRLAVMGLRELRKSRNMTQKDLAQMCGINFRSLQDYEQGHKKLTSANGDILLRLSTVLGCSTTDLLLDDNVKGAKLLPANSIDVATIQSQQFYCAKYKTSGRWVCTNGTVATMFYYNGEKYSIPFRAVFTPVMLPCLKEAAILQMEEIIDNILFREDGFEEW